MGKAEEEISFSTLSVTLDENGGARCHKCQWIARIVRLRCLVALVLSIAVLLSAVFWLPLFPRHGPDKGDPDPDLQSGASILAGFNVQRPVSELKANIPTLQYDIFEEIGVPNSTVVVNSLEPSYGSNWTNVVFGVWPYPKSSTISSAGLSILRSSFVSLVVKQSTLHLTPSLFGNVSSFQVLGFPGGITVIPPQSAFLLQKVQTLFNFTLNFSIYEVEDKIDELKDQMKLGLKLNAHENLYVSLTNKNGSTVARPTTVSTSVLLSVWNRPPSKSRLKELAQAITGYPARNLGLNNTVFGRVKQIRLSSFLQHSLNSGGSSSTTWLPSPAPQSHVNHHHHPHHHHHHHHHHSVTHLAPAPAPQHNYWASPPCSCRFGFPPKSESRIHLVPTSPKISQHHFFASHPLGQAPAPAALSVPESSPLPAASFSHAQPPSKSIKHAMTPGKMIPSSDSVAGFHSLHCALVPVVVFLLMHL